jgi:hypothetical protein
MADPQQFPHTGKNVREQLKRTGPDGKPGKAGRIEGKGKASTSHRDSGGKNAR